jgi:hypothetical protein
MGDQKDLGAVQQVLSWISDEMSSDLVEDMFKRSRREEEQEIRRSIVAELLEQRPDIDVPSEQQELLDDVMGMGSSNVTMQLELLYKRGRFDALKQVFDKLHAAGLRPAEPER